VIIGESVINIGNNSFSSNTLVSVFYIGTHIISTAHAFDNCNALTTVCVPPGYNSNSFCGKTITSNTAECESFRSMFDYCFRASYNNGTFSKEKRSYAIAWERRSNACAIYSCNGTALVSQPRELCNNASACFTGKCNEKTGKCEYKRVSGYDELKKNENQCYEVVCNGNNEWSLKLRDDMSRWIDKTNGCVKYDCDNQTGKYSTVIESCNNAPACYVGFCNEATGKCEYNKTRGWEKLEENLCYEIVCKENEWVLQNNATEYESLSSGCVKYECNNDTGIEKIILPCDNASACFVGQCNESTAQCEYREKDGYFELKEQENQCYEVVCDENNEWSLQKSKKALEWEDTKSRCRVYKCDNETGPISPNTVSCSEKACHVGKCNEETGECIYEKIEGYAELAKLENHCFEVVCDGTKWILQQRQSAIEWENQTDECMFYQCNNESGPVSWSICNSSRTVGNKCVEGKCVPVVCPAGQYQFFGNCYNCSSVLSCGNCSNAVSCDSCKEGFILDTDGTCKRDCSIFGDGCTECNAKKCLKCTKQDCCRRMEYYWDATLEVCQDPAEKFGVGCLRADEEKCIECTAASCCEDKQFFDFNKVSCENCSKYGDECSKCNSAGCLICDGGKIVGTDGTNCMSCAEVYGAGCESCNQNTCSKVHDGFALIRTVSRKCSDLFGDKCSSCTADGCEVCSEGYQPFHGYCKSCSEVFGEGCSECSESECIACNSNHLTLINGVCADCLSAYGEGCIACNNVSNCTQHDVGYFIYSGYAVSCDVLPPAVQEICYTDQGSEIPASFYALRSLEKKHVRDDDESNMIDIDFNGQTYSVLCSSTISNCLHCDGLTCEQCEEGYVVYGNGCKLCSEIHGDSCEKCSLTSCDECSDNKVAMSGVCQNCVDINQHCSVCTPEGSCEKCDEGYIEKDGGCTTCPILFGAGCTECNSTVCLTCVEDSCCLDDTHIIVKEGNRFCGSCDVITENCATCTSTQCLSCNDNMVVDTDDSYKCKQCSELFFGCSECDSYKCSKCSNSAWILTDNGCAYEENEPDDQPEVSNSSSSSSSTTSNPISTHSPSSHVDVSSKPIVIPSSSSKSGSNKSNGGMIAGIVVAVVLVAAIVAVAIYFVVTSGPKQGKLDPSISDNEGIEFISMSVL